VSGLWVGRLQRCVQGAHAERNQCNAQTAALQLRIAGLPEKHNIHALNELRRETGSAYHTARRELETRISEEYSDVSHVMSSAAEWEAKDKRD
jgi:hypothetical protein